MGFKESRIHIQNGLKMPFWMLKLAHYSYYIDKCHKVLLIGKQVTMMIIGENGIISRGKRYLAATKGVRRKCTTTTSRVLLLWP